MSQFLIESPTGKSLPEVHRSITVPGGKARARRFLAFAGPGFLVSVGYMDPGNWGTDLAGGSQFGYRLMWVILLSNLMAQFLQVLCSRLGVVTGKDLAMVCRDSYLKPVAIAMWLFSEVAIVACDLAEVIGSAVALNLLFKLPLEIGVLITGLDVLLLLGFMKFGFRKVEAIVFTLVMTVFGCFAYELAIAQPAWGPLIKGSLIPTIPNMEALTISLGILGATVMPHNLYLHSSIVQTRRTGEGASDVRQALRYNALDTILALSLAFLVNGAILAVSAAAFGGTGTVVTELQQGHELLRTGLGAGSAVVFAVALLASGQSSTITGTLAGQVVMEGFMHWKLKPWVRRLITRSLAIIPAIVIIHLSHGRNTVELLVASQIVLSMQLPFAIFPLIRATSDDAQMGQFVNPGWVKWTGYGLAAVIAILNLYLLWDQIGPVWVGVSLGSMAAFAAYVRWIWHPAVDGTASR